MRTFAALSALALLLFGQPSMAAAQQASELATLTQIISGTEIEVVWSRPSLRGRTEIFGRQVPWGEVWTPGANRATTIRFSKDVVFNDEPVAAGRYSVWLQVLEDEPWQLALHADTTLFHSDHPYIEDTEVHVGVNRTRTEDLQESLDWDLDRIRIDGAELVMHWGYDQVSIPIGVDPGIVMTTTPDEVQPYLGEWMYDDSPSVPTREQVARFLGDPADPTGRYLEVLLAGERPRAIQIHHNAESGLLFFDDALNTAGEAAFYSGSGVDPEVVYGQALLPRSEGFFAIAGTFGGEVSAVNPQFAPIIEFEFDEDGRAVAFTIRGPDDSVQGTGVRAGG